jgi:uncharacterized protein (DUF1810 family)
VTEADLIHFVNAQAQVYRQVVEELTDGHKRTHWMWFIFPQLSELGHSAMARRQGATSFLIVLSLSLRLR